MGHIKTSSVEQTIDVGTKLGGILMPGDVVSLTGGLGAGKTAFVKGIAIALGIKGYVTSPTFTIINEYCSGKIPLYHFDAYRIDDSCELIELGFEEYVNGRGIVAIEWAELVKQILPSEYVKVDIKRDAQGGENDRVICIEFIGESYRQRENKFKTAIKSLKAKHEEIDIAADTKD